MYSIRVWRITSGLGYRFIANSKSELAKQLLCSAIVALDILTTEYNNGFNN